MADEDITLDGKPLHSLRVADLKAALEKRNLPKSGQKNTLIKRLKGALMLENLQKSSSSHSGLQPNSQIGEEMCQNSFIKQYLAKQQELLRQRLEREAQRVEGADESPAVPEEDEEHSEDNESSSYMSDKRCPRPSQSTLSRAEERGGGALVGHGMISYSSDTGPSPALHCQESPEAPGARMQRAMGHKDPPVPSPPRAVASLSVRVLGKPDHQGLPPAVPRVQEKEGTAPSEPGSAHPVLHLSRSAGVSTGSNVYKDSDDDDGDDECDDDEDWGPGPGKARKGNRVPPQPQQMPPNVPSASARSKRKLQPPQHIPPPQVHHTPMQLRHPTPPPSPPPDLFPLPDTPKQSPPDPEHQEGEVPVPGPRMPSFPPPSMQRQDSDSSSRSSSPEPSVKCWSGPLSLLVHKMESEGAFHESAKISEDTAPSAAGSSSKSPLKKMDRKTQENREESEKEREQQYEQERERRKAEEQEREKKSMEEEKEERKRLEEEEREQEGKHQDDKERREEKQQKEDQDKKQLAAQDRKVVTKSQDSGSSSDSDSGSDSSSQSSQSSSSSRDKPLPSRPPKKVGQKDEEKKKTNLSEVSEQQQLSKREVSEPSAASVTEVEPDTESSVAEQPVSGAQPENSENRMEESTTPKAFAARKISLTSSKTSPATTDGGGEAETGTGAGRKRRWGSSTAVTAKKPSISITTDSLKSLIPDIKINQDPVVDLHAEELQLSGDEENMAKNCSDQDTGLKIRRTVTQVVPGDSQENGQADQKEEGEKTEREKQRRTSRDKRKSSLSEEASETQMHVKLEEEVKKVTPSDTLVRRSISQQKSGVSITIDDPVRTAKQPSPPCGKISNIIHVTNLVRPFTLGQLKELLSRTGTMVEEGFWIDKIKSHCFVTYATTEEAVATRAAINGANWPSSNPKVLSVNFCEQDELDFHKGILKPERVEDHCVQPVPPQNRPPPLMPERDRDRDRERERDKEHERDRERGVAGVRDLWAEREREMERRERARGEREWDRDKVREFARPGEDGRRSRSRDKERRKRDRAKSKERRTDKKEKADEPPAKLLDDLFLKTKAAPCIYWLPLTEEQAAQRLLERTERQKERERRRKEQQEEEEKKREEEKKERLKVREKESDVVVSSGAAARGPNGDRERDRGRDREGDKRRDGGHRPGRLSAGAGSGRRSRSRSNPRDRRR